MRSDEGAAGIDCDDEMTQLACEMGSDECPAACRDDAEEEDNKVVKSGDLAIKASAAEGKKAVLNGGTSDLDTITIKVSEAITINSITLERYGFSSYRDVANIWLENADGVKIANEKSISSSKDTVTLNLKKEYKNFENDDTITVVVETNAFVEGSCATALGVAVPTAKTEAACYKANNTNVWTAGTYEAKDAGTSIGFKVTAVDSSAKNLDISNYSPYLYDMIVYEGSDVTVNAKGKDTKYHFNADESYEVAKFQVKASNSAVKVYGFTLTNVAATNKLDIDRYIDDVVVSLNDGTELKNVKYEANKDNELKVTFDDVELAINKSAVFTVKVELKDFDKFNTNVKFQIAKSSDVNVAEQKNDVRANITLNGAVQGKLSLSTYTFQGGKIEVSNSKISDNVDAGAGSTDIVIGKGKITVPESVKLNDFNIVVTTTTIDPSTAIETFKMFVGNDEFDGTLSANGIGTATYTFKSVTIDESDDVEFVVDLKDETNPASLKGKTLTFQDFDKAKLTDGTTLGRYEDSRQDILAASDWAGSISLSKIRIQAARGSLTNTTKDQEYLVKQTARKTIFEGTYTAQKQDVSLSEFAVRLSDTNVPSGTMEITYYLSVDGKEVGSFEYEAGRKATKANGTTDALGEGDSTDVSFIDKYAEPITNILIEKGNKVSIKLEANVKADNIQKTYAPVIILRGEDKDGNPAGLASEFTAKIKVVTAGSVTVSDSTTTPRESVEVVDNNVTVAKFYVKSSKNTEGMYLNNFVLNHVAGTLAQTNLRVKVAGEELVAGTDFVVSAAANKCYNGITVSSEANQNVCETAGKTWVAAANSIVVDGLSEDIPNDDNGVEVEVIAKTATAGVYTYTLSNVNGSNPGTKFNKKVLASVASIKSQENIGDSTTKFTFAVDKDSTNTPVQNVVLFTKKAGVYTQLNDPLSTVEEGTTLEVTNASSVQFIDAIGYACVDGDTNGDGVADAATNDSIEDSECAILIEKASFRDFFKTTSADGRVDAQVYRTK